MLEKLAKQYLNETSANKRKYQTALALFIGNRDRQAILDFSTIIGERLKIIRSNEQWIERASLRSLSYRVTAELDTLQAVAIAAMYDVST